MLVFIFADLESVHLLCEYIQLKFERPFDHPNHNSPIRTTRSLLALAGLGTQKGNQHPPRHSGKLRKRTLKKGSHIFLQNEITID